MGAQAGNAILLQYGAQGTQQPGASIQLNYSAPTSAGASRISLATRASWQRGSTRRVPLDACHVGTARLDLGHDGRWVAARPRTGERSAPWVKTRRTDDGRVSPWSAIGVALGASRLAGWTAAMRADDESLGRWGSFDMLLDDDRSSSWCASRPADAIRKGVFDPFMIPVWIALPYIRPAGLAANFRARGENWAPPAPHAANFLIDIEAYRRPRLDAFGAQMRAPSSRDAVGINPWGAGKRIDDTTIIPWLRFSRPLNPGWGVIVPGGPPTPQPGESIIIPVKRAYIVINDVLLARVDNNTIIEAIQLSVDFDCDSWLPIFSAVVPESFRDAVMPDPGPVEVYVYINGSEFRFLVEKISRNRQFARKSVTIYGRGLACELSSPYAAAAQHTNSSAMTAQQLIGGALEYTTYTQTWGITDWLVPANAFSLYGTPADVAGKVAEASGSVLAADWALRDLRMLPRYPVAPWNWATATPDYVIPSAVVQTESLEWIEKPDYNVVYVSGVQAGVLAQVKRTGTAGDKPAQMVTHPLITHNDAARQRGTSILADTGRKALIQISLPVLESTGVIDICRLVEFSDGANTRRGIVRANKVSVAWPTVRQTPIIEAAP